MAFFAAFTAAVRREPPALPGLGPKLRSRRTRPGPNPAVVTQLLKYISKAKWMTLGADIHKGPLIRQTVRRPGG